jgi:antitoxin (DNA-binding transcriptional repressor) of toxin-antitoxin stability system
MFVKSVTEARAQLSRRIELALSGEEVVIGKAGKPVVVLRAYRRSERTRTPGALRGKIRIADDFDRLPPDIAQAFGANSE